MSVGPGFFRSEAAGAVLARAARIAGTPVSVHYVMDGHEGPLVAGVGACEACLYVAGLSGGKAACRSSRGLISKAALTQGVAVAEVCHMGFGVLCVPALTGDAYVLAFGPFVHSGDDAALEFGALEGLANLTGERPARFPAPLDDIHRAARGSMAAVAEWTVEELARLRPGGLHVQVDAAPEPTLAPKAKRARRARITDAQAIASAVAGGNRARVRALFSVSMEEALGGKPAVGQLPTRMLALLAESIAACAKAGIDTTPAMQLMPAATVSVSKLATVREATDCAVGVLAALIRKPRERLPAVMQAYRPLDRLILAALPEGIPLPALAASLGKSPSAITLHLQKRFNMSFSEYQGRMRVERAKELLRRTRLSATVIGIRVGIDDQSNFGKLFRRHTGMTPMAYRAKHGKKSS